MIKFRKLKNLTTYYSQLSKKITIVNILSFYFIPNVVLILSFIFPERFFFIIIGIIAEYLFIFIMFVKPISIIFNIKFLKKRMHYRKQFGILLFWFVFLHTVGLFYAGNLRLSYLFIYFTVSGYWFCFFYWFNSFSNYFK